MRRDRTITHRWPLGSEQADQALGPRDDLLRETPGTTADGRTEFRQAHGPLHEYLRTVEVEGDTRTHDTVVDRYGYRRGSSGGYAKGGTSFELSRLLVGEVSIGSSPAQRSSRR